MLDQLELEHMIEGRRDEVERLASQNATMEQLKTRPRARRKPRRAGLRLRIALMLIRLGSRLVGGNTPSTSRNSTNL